jgi:S-adenosylhomocysteine hydrolase
MYNNPKLNWPRGGGSARDGNAALPKPMAEAIARPRFPVIEALKRSPILSGLPLTGLFVPQVLHARYSVIAFNEALIELGANPDRLVLIFKDYEYPERKQVLDELTNRLHIRIAPLAHIQSEVARLKHELITAGGRLLAVDDGGYIACACAADDELLAASVGFVEQTTRGVSAVRKLYQDLSRPISRPHLSLPCSEIKRTFECGTVGECFMQALAWHVGKPLTGRSAAVIGASGVIGSAVANSAVNAGMHVLAYDLAPRARYWALNSFGQMQVSNSKAEAIREADIVIGATGTNVLHPLDLKQLKNGVLLASASSGQYEFPVALLDQLALEVVPYRALAGRSPHGLTYRMPWGKAITLLDGGRPLNLGIAAGPEAACFDLILALLVAGAAELAAGRYNGESGIIDCFDDICSRHQLDGLFMLLHGEDG